MKRAKARFINFIWNDLESKILYLWYAAHNGYQIIGYNYDLAALLLTSLYGKTTL